ncbi:hypothetical protein ACP70R_029830 [Stipagrostis hirtigluma subsp. patula]
MEAARLGIEMNKILVLCLLLWAFLLGAVSAGSDANKHLTCDNVNCDKPEVIVSSMNKQKGYLLIPSTSARSLGRLPMSVTARRKLTPSKSGLSQSSTPASYQLVPLDQAKKARELITFVILLQEP